MKKFTNLFLSVCAVALLAGCSGKDGDPGPTGPAGPAGPSGQNLTGNLFGFVNPVDEYGNALPKSGVTVTLDGVTPAATATTNADGRYEFASLRNGTYNLSFSRTSLSSFRRLGVGHVGGDQPTFLGTTTLSASSTTAFGSVSVAGQTNTDVTLRVPLSNVGAPTGTFNRFAIFASANPGTNASNGTLLFTSSSNSSVTNVFIPKSTLNNTGFASGSAVYIVVYGVPAFLLSYTDPATGRPVYTGLSTASSNQVAFIVP